MVVSCFFFFVFFLMMALFQISCARRCHSNIRNSKISNYNFWNLQFEIFEFSKCVTRTCYTVTHRFSKWLIFLTLTKHPKFSLLQTFFSSNSGVSWWDGDWKRPQKIISPPFQHPGARGGARAPALVVGYYLISTIREEPSIFEMKTLT